MPKTPRTTAAARHAVKLAELGVAAPQVVTHRLTRMALAGAAPGARDRQEFLGMVLEKQVAFTQAWMAMAVECLRWQQTIAMSMLTGATAHQHLAQARSAAARAAAAGLAPVHRKAVSNAKRLARTKLR